MRDGSLVVARMYFADEIWPLEGVLPERRRTVDERELETALELIERFSGEFDPTAYEDRYLERLLEIVERKRRGGEVQEVKAETPEETPDLLAALRESLARHTRPSARADGRAKDGLASLTVEELIGRARELGIEGRSKMTKGELVAAIEKAER